MKIAAVADTHAAVWYVFDNPRMSDRANDFIDAAVAAGLKIAVSSISLAEIVYLVEKLRLPASAYHEVRNALADSGNILVEEAFTSEIVESLRRVSREDVPDMPDRIVAATALHLGVPVISRDARIRASSVETIW